MAYHSNGYSGDERDFDRNVDDGVKPTYLMEHLATFTVNEETQYPNDGMRKLFQLEKTNGIWSQKMQFCLDRNVVLIMDYETGSIVERFHGDSIQEPTAFTSQDPMEMYNNILVFIVNNSGNSNPNSEMHIFQCQSISAQDLAEDLKDMQRGKAITRHRKNSNPPPSYKPPPQQREYRESDSELTTNNDDNSSTTSEQYERDVTVLNHCFDDIEKFIARLQHAAAASKELERRRRTRKGKKSDNGDGILTMRTKPPLEKEFFDIFQKFKLSFNLLAKLKAHIHDPNAPELVHFLFTPLALIVEASHDTYFDRHLPQKIVSPLLTREAINLLNNCVTSKETELWHSLGAAWLMPRDEWKGNVAAYHPVFLDKWSPDYPVDQMDPDKHDYDYDYEPPGQENQFMYKNNELPKDHDHDPNMSASRSDISADSIERNGAEDFKREQEKWLEKLNKKNAQVVQVTYPRTANNDKELTVVRGEYLEILDNTRKWWKARNRQGQVAHVPHTIVTKVNQPDIYNNPIYNPHYSRSSRPESADRFSEGQSINDHPPPVPTAPAEVVRRERLETPVPPPPPPPAPLLTPPPTPLPPPMKRSRSIQPEANGDEMQKELNALFAVFRQKRKDIDIKPTPAVYITQKSNADEVAMWLKEKEFSPEICKAFTGRSGDDLFSMKKDHLEKVCGPSEGKRLAGQIEIQKSHCGYQTVRSSELLAILAKARKKIDGANEN